MESFIFFSDLLDEENVFLPATYSPPVSSSIELVNNMDVVMKIKAEEKEQEENIAAEIKAQEVSVW